MGDNLDIGMIQNPLEWALWPDARAFLDPALALSDESWPEVEAELASGGMQLVAVMNKRGGDPYLAAAAIIRTIYAKAGPLVEIFIVGGRNFRDWASALAQTVAAGAKAGGCVAIRTWGRKGWTDTLAPLGWKADVICFEKAL